MQLREGVVLAMTQIRSQKLKSFFSLLGVIMGVMFLIIVVTIIAGLDRYVRQDFTAEVFGVSTVTLSRWPEVNVNVNEEEWRARLRRPTIKYADADAIRAQLTVPARVAVESTTRADGVGDNGGSVSNVMVMGASPEIFQIRDLKIARGRPFTPQEARAGMPVVVIGSQTAEAVFQDLDPIGHTLRIRGFPYRVIGVLEKRGSLFGQSLDNLAIAPARSPIQDITNPHGVVDDVIVQTINPDQLQEAEGEIEGIMRTRHRLRPTQPADFSLETAEQAISFWNKISQILFIALPSFAAISLVVGGIVIMNIMLVSVMERTREIGVRKAIGARRRDILTQVLIESATLSTVGAILGVLAGLGAAGLVSALSPIPAAVSVTGSALGVALGLTVGILAGVYPAARASKLDPVEALRHE